MTTGQTFDQPNEYRKDFYDEVMYETKDLVHGEMGAKDAGSSLCKYIDPQDLLDSPAGPRWPLVILSFDEAHLLTDLPRHSSSIIDTRIGVFSLSCDGVSEQSSTTLYLRSSSRLPEDLSFSLPKFGRTLRLGCTISTSPYTLFRR
ncbi:hypothetical protein BC826DRAFT_716513 [Russula brevipes]|nr:hypothetical protein BC826DRAFT_716513 [Russula brevipes]